MGQQRSARCVGAGPLVSRRQHPEHLGADLVRLREARLKELARHIKAAAVRIKVAELDGLSPATCANDEFEVV